MEKIKNLKKDQKKVYLSIHMILQMGIPRGTVGKESVSMQEMPV